MRNNLYLKIFFKLFIQRSSGVLDNGIREGSDIIFKFKYYQQSAIIVKSSLSPEIREKSLNDNVSTQNAP